MKSRFRAALVLSVVLVVARVLWNPTGARAAERYVPFEGEKSAWHDGFDRFDFVMDEETMAITPFKAPEVEKFGVKDPAKGQRRCIVIVPKEAAPGHPWSWRGCYWDHQPQTEIELLRRGFHVAYISANATLKPGKEWDAWYAFLTEKHGLSSKPAFIGMSRGGEYAYTWATANPDKVSCIYADNPGASRELLMRIGALASNDVPLLHVCGSIDPLLGKYSTAIEGIYQQLGGRMSVMINEHLIGHGFARKPVMEGAGRAAGDAYAWAIENPGKVSCIYGENPVLRSFMSKARPLDNLAPLAKAGVPLLRVCGSLDPALADHTRVVEKRYKELGGPINVIIKEGEGHYPLAPKDPKPVVDFITEKAR